jgi:hypothetical protein
MRTYPNNYVGGRFSQVEAVEIIDRELTKNTRLDPNAPYAFTGDDFVQFGVDVDALAQRIVGTVDIPALNEIAVVCYKGEGDVKVLNNLLRRKTLSNGHFSTYIGNQYDTCTAVLPSGRPSRKMIRRQVAQAPASCHA